MLFLLKGLKSGQDRRQHNGEEGREARRESRDDRNPETFQKMKEDENQECSMFLKAMTKTTKMVMMHTPEYYMITSSLE